MKVVLKETLIKAFDVEDGLSISEIADLYADAELIMEFDPVKDHFTLEIDKGDGYETAIDNGYGQGLSLSQ